MDPAPDVSDRSDAADASPELARWRLASDVVDAALDLDGAERERVVRERCAGDPALESEVRRWLAAADAPAPLFDAPALPPEGAAALARGVGEGSRVGPWRVVGFVGAGGMGAVYEAERDDGQFRKRVALKVVRALPERALLVRRFHREREILAGLDHPNIARLLDGGVTADGMPYYAMELVERGEPIDAYCDRRRLGVAARVALARQVCAAVAYAHRRLVVHRDLKPSNILVTEDGVVKLLDFGIARLLAPETRGDAPAPGDASTHLTSRMLTPAYASPEQFRGDPPTVASDVYSLAAVLYHLLAGRPPHGAARTWRDVEIATLEREPERPSAVPLDAGAAAARAATPEQLRRQLRGDLDTIVLAGLRKDAARRYGSVEALDADLARYLDGRPVAARPDRWGYRAGKFVRRHRAGVALAALAVAALVATTGAALVQAARARQEADRAATVATYLLGLLTLPYPYDSGATRQRSLRDLLDSGQTRAHMLTAAGGAMRSDVYMALARGYSGLGDYRTAASLAGRALVLRRAELGASAYGVASARTELAEQLRLAGDLAPAIAQYDSALPTIRRQHGPRAVVVAVVLQARARAERASGDLARAERTLAESIAIFADSSGETRLPFANAHQTLGHIRLERGRAAAAESSYRTALAIRTRLGASPVEVANSEGDVAEAALRQGRLAEAESLVARALATKRARLGDGSPETVDDLVRLARLALARGRAADAERGLRAAVARYGEAGDVPFWRLVPALDALGEASLRLGRAAAAESALARGLDLLGKAQRSPGAQRASLLAHLAEAARARGRDDEARRLLAESAAIYRAVGGADDARARAVEARLAAAR